MQFLLEHSDRIKALRPLHFIANMANIAGCSPALVKIVCLGFIVPGPRFYRLDRTFQRKPKDNCLFIIFLFNKPPGILLPGFSQHYLAGCSQYDDLDYTRGHSR